MFCTKCGKDAGDAKFCPECGAGLGAEVLKTENPNGTAENIAGLLSYVLGWVTGIVFFLIDKRPFVRFHAMQSIIVFGVLTVANIILGGFIVHLPYGLWSLFNMVNRLISLAGFVLWVLLIVKAYQGKYYKLPAAGDIAERFAASAGHL
jgi:uncharacterized membrane protein